MKTHVILILLGFSFMWACDDSSEPASMTAALTDLGMTVSDSDEDTGVQQVDMNVSLDDGFPPDQGEPEPESVEPECVPTRAGFSEVLPILETACGDCHGETPQYGAPYSVFDYDALMAGDEGRRKIDAVVREVRLGGMPPYGQPPLMAEEQATLLDWATCGENMGEPPVGPTPGGLDVSRPMYDRDRDLPSGAASVEFRAQNAVVSEDEDDVYRCYSFHWTAGDQRLIHRFEPIVDDSRVLHHIVLYKVPMGPGDGAEVTCGADLEGAIYAWAPGQVPFQFPSGGLQVDNRHRYVLEIHYNNRAEHPDVSDTSGVRIYHVPREGEVYGLVTLGPDGFTLPANRRTEVEGQCRVEQDFTILAAAPHMHEIGDSLQTTLIRSDGSEEDVVTLNGWQFETQIYYDTDGLIVRSGDRLETRCVFENTDAFDRRFGPFTDDEMCFNFLYVTPPAAESRCDEPIDVGGYAPGQCAADGASDIGRVFDGRYHLGQPDALTENETPSPGTYRLSTFTVYLSSPEYPPVVLDLDTMTSTVAGSLVIHEDGRLWLDAIGITNAVTDTGARFERPIEVSFSGLIDPGSSAPNRLSVRTDCPSESVQAFSYSADRNQIVIHRDFQDPTPGTVVMIFERTE